MKKMSDANKEFGLPEEKSHDRKRAKRTAFLIFSKYSSDIIVVSTDFSECAFTKRGAWDIPELILPQRRYSLSLIHSVPLRWISAFALCDNSSKFF